MILDPDRWARLNDLYHRAESLPPDQRRAFLEAECADDADLHAEVLKLLNTSPGSAASAVEAVQRARSQLTEPGRPSLLGQKIGAYRLARELGRGGMGVVYLGVREDGDFAQEAAIKVLPGALVDPQARWRFENERRILADLQHPGIARLIDGGETEAGLPYVIMDYVDGVPLDEFCRVHRLTTRQRIELFLRVCDAVAHAHTHLVVHRDLKPANILVVEDGTPSLLDFGIAKLLEAEGDPGLTRQGVRALTPSYASPEQLRGEPVGTASDVYALGVLLYELLADTPPFDLTDASPGQLEAIIGTRVPKAPSVASARTALAGDLDTIVLKALEKEPARRYTSVELFSADLRRHLEGHPVSARPPTLRYRAGKFVRRNTGGVAASAMLLGLLIAFSTTVTIQAQRIATERDAAAAERDRATAVSTFLIDVFESNDPNNSKGVDLTAGEILSRGGAQIRESLAEQPRTRAEVLETIGVLYRKLGAYDSASVFLTEALELREAEFGREDPDYTGTRNNLGILSENMGDFERARELFTDVVEQQERTFGPNSEEVAAALYELARFKQGRGEVDVAPLYERSIAIRRALPEVNHEEILRALTGLASLLRRQGLPDSAIVVMEGALASQRSLYGDEHLSVASTINNLGAIHYTTGHLDEAQALFRQAVALRTRLVGDLHPLVFTAKNNLALTLSESGGLEESEALYRGIIQGRKDRGDTPATYASPLHNLGLLLHRMDQFDEAIEAFTESVEARRASLGPGHPDVAFPLIGLAGSKDRLGDAAGAEAAYLEALELREGAFGTSDRIVALDRYAYGRFLLRQGRREEASTEINRALTIQREVLAPGHVDMGETLTTLGRMKMDDGEAEDARTLLLEARAILETTQSRALEVAIDLLDQLDGGETAPPTR